MDLQFPIEVSSLSFGTNYLVGNWFKLPLAPNNFSYFDVQSEKFF